jgi:hypothetical protein
MILLIYHQQRKTKQNGANRGMEASDARNGQLRSKLTKIYNIGSLTFPDV